MSVWVVTCLEFLDDCEARGEPWADLNTVSVHVSRDEAMLARRALVLQILEELDDEDPRHSDLRKLADQALEALWRERCRGLYVPFQWAIDVREVPVKNPEQDKIAKLEAEVARLKRELNVWVPEPGEFRPYCCVCGVNQPKC